MMYLSPLPIIIFGEVARFFARSDYVKNQNKNNNFFLKEHRRFTISFVNISFVVFHRIFLKTKQEYCCCDIFEHTVIHGLDTKLATII